MRQVSEGTLCWIPISHSQICMLSVPQLQRFTMPTMVTHRVFEHCSAQGRPILRSAWIKDSFSFMKPCHVPTRKTLAFHVFTY